MLDLHTHSQYSKHAKGEIEDVVKSAISKGIKTLCLTDHAPYFVDSENRILDSELVNYVEEVKFIASKYSEKIKVLVGLEVDYHPEHEDYIANLIKSVDVDYVLGAIHYVYVDGVKVNVWDIENLSSREFLDNYFFYLHKMIVSGFFDAIAHPDTIMRGGIRACEFYERFVPLLLDMKAHNVAYEINCSSLTKSNYNLETKCKTKGEAVYPNYDLVATMVEQGLSFTIGSDAHSPSNVGSGVSENLKLCIKAGMDSITYYEARKPVVLPINRLLIEEGS
ncbi:TPA: histidinol-phosphatase HisJ family protein [Vibrio vulnificus]|nr:histidinol-phosphatase [Vibrio vulnificus]HAS6352315.1 histidinol-phosphatase HisJ family protein [Vibrio vulnificus]HAS6366887.1 histidinol-phosphatase HisJ family protein [Vibrio vulnificus]HDY7610756.1 histidinol-phosphatase [Vibrio vulnificus]